MTLPVETYEVLDSASAQAAIAAGEVCPYCGDPLDPAMLIVREGRGGVERLVHWICHVEEAR